MKDKDIPMMQCDWCWKMFPADPNACVETFIEAFQSVDEDDEFVVTQAGPFSRSDFSDEAWEGMKKDMELSDSELSKLLENGEIDGLGGIVCLECQDEGIEEDEM